VIPFVLLKSVCYGSATVPRYCSGDSKGALLLPSILKKRPTMHLPPTPEPRDLLPPLLACLPTTFVSPRPPPALLPLLAPILRQRVNYLSGTSNQSDGWVRLLSWDAHRGAKLPSIVEHLELEPHPVSGEVEIDDPHSIQYRRLDSETLHARLELGQFELAPLYVWCETDEHGGTGPGWKLTELRSLEDAEDGAEWYETIGDANNNYTLQSIAVPQAVNGGNCLPTPESTRQQRNEDQDDDDYWAAYDQTPGRTPAQRSPAPRASTSSALAHARNGGQSDADYYNRYGSEVQPAMDAHDPDEDHPELGNTTLNGTSQRPLSTNPPTQTPPPFADPDLDTRADWEKALYPNGRPGAHDSAFASAMEQSRQSSLEMPRPISPTTSHSSVEKLEEQAERMSDRAEMGIKQHIATDVKSLFRLAKSVGMDRREFERIVRTELDLLGMME